MIERALFDTCHEQSTVVSLHAETHLGQETNPSKRACSAGESLGGWPSAVRQVDGGNGCGLGRGRTEDE